MILRFHLAVPEVDSRKEYFMYKKVGAKIRY